MKITITSFGFKHGRIPAADVQFDVRFLPNPYYVPELKMTTGLMPTTAAYVIESRAAVDFFRYLLPLLEFLISQYSAKEKETVTIAIGCTGGRHRSVAVAEKLSRLIGDLVPQSVAVEHRDIGR